MCSSFFKDQKPKHFHDLLFEDIFLFFSFEGTLYVTIFSFLGHSNFRVTVALPFREIISYNALLTASTRRSKLLQLAVCLLRIPKIRLHPIFWRHFSFFTSLVFPYSTLCLYSCITFLYLH